MTVSSPSSIDIKNSLNLMSPEIFTGNEPLISDHGPVKFKVIHTAEEKVTEISLITFNKMNQCHSKNSCRNQASPFSNNPWNIDEDHSTFRERTQWHYRCILNTIQESKASKSLDFILLQEAFDLIPHPRNSIIQKQGISNFNTELKKHAWKMVSSEPNSKALVTLYNAERFKKVNVKSKYTVDFRSTILYTEFQEKKQKSSVAVGNCHFDYKVNPQNKIYDLQIKQIALNIFTIFAGDTNHSPLVLKNFVGNYYYATNFETMADKYRISDENGYLKRYDNLAASPTKNGFLSIEEVEFTYFKIQNNKVCAYSSEKNLPKSQQIYLSATGLPWFADAYLKVNFIDKVETLKKLSLKIKESSENLPYVLISLNERKQLMTFEFPGTRARDQWIEKFKLKQLIVELKCIGKAHSFVIPSRMLHCIFFVLNMSYAQELIYEIKKPQSSKRSDEFS